MKPEQLGSLRKAAWAVMILAVGGLIFTLIILSLHTATPSPVGAQAGRPPFTWWWLTYLLAGLALLGVGAWILKLTNALERAWDERKPEPALQAAPPPPKPDAKPATSGNNGAEPGAEALLLLSLLQEKGRFVDFVMEDITPYSDDQVGAAARVVHQGCREVIADSFSPRPVAEVGEKEPITLPSGFDAAAFRVVGQVKGEAPFTGQVMHKGWRATQVKLPRQHKVSTSEGGPVIVPAEIQL